MKQKLVIIGILLVFFLVYSGGANAQCAMCKQAAETSLKSDPSSLARSLNSGILYLMAVPYIMIVFIFRKQIVKLFRNKFGRVSESEAN